MIINKILEQLCSEIPDTRIKDHFGDPVLIYKSSIWLCWMGVDNELSLCINSNKSIIRVDLKNPDALKDAKQYILQSIEELDARIKRAATNRSTNLDSPYYRVI